MKRTEGRKASQAVNGIIHASLVSMLGFLIFSSPGYGSPYIPVNDATAPVTIEEAALFAGLGAEPVLASLGVIAAVDGEVSSTAYSSLLAGLQDGDAVYTETQLDIELLDGTDLTARPPCQDSCSL
jgi:hypothetical protein